MSFVLLGILNSQAAGANIPASLDPALWVDASDASTITESGGSVSQWDNKGTGENLVQATSSLQPTTGASTVNGLNVLDFAGDFFVTSDKTQWKFLHDGTTYFIASVIKFDTATAPGVDMFIWSTSGGSPANVGGEALYDTSGSNGLFTGVANGSSRSVQIITSNFFTPNQIVIYSALTDPDNATVSDRIEYYENNTQGATNNAATGGVSSSDPTLNFTIAGIEGAGIALTGQIGEFIIVQGDNATEENRQAVVDYLNDKWGAF